MLLDVTSFGSYLVNDFNGLVVQKWFEITHVIDLFHISYIFHILNIFIQGTNSISILFYNLALLKLKKPNKLFTNKLDKKYIHLTTISNLQT